MQKVFINNVSLGEGILRTYRDAYVSFLWNDVIIECSLARHYNDKMSSNNEGTWTWEHDIVEGVHKKDSYCCIRQLPGDREKLLPFV